MPSFCESARAKVLRGTPCRHFVGNPQCYVLCLQVMRDLIETQMHVLEMQYKEEHGITGNNSDEGDVSEEGRENKADLKDGTRRETRDDEETRRMERDRRQHRGGNKRVRYYDERDSDTKRSRR